MQRVQRLEKCKLQRHENKKKVFKLAAVRSTNGRFPLGCTPIWPPIGFTSFNSWFVTHKQSKRPLFHVGGFWLVRRWRQIQTENFNFFKYLSTFSLEFHEIVHGVGSLDALQLCFWVGGDGTKRSAGNRRRESTPSIGDFTQKWVFRLKNNSDRNGLKSR